nr:MAG TPA: hypothetical protein [Caudoviricetes sp.]
MFSLSFGYFCGCCDVDDAYGVSCAGASGLSLFPEFS